MVRLVLRAAKRDGLVRQPGVRFMRKGTPLAIETAKGIRTWWIAPGGHIEASTMQVERCELPRWTVGFHVTEHEDHMDREHWRRLTKVAATSLIQSIAARVDQIREASGVSDPDILFGLWPREAQMKCWLEQDNWYFHVIVKMPVAGAAFKKPSNFDLVPM